MTAENTQTRYEAVQMVVSVLADGSRSDRFLRQAEDGHYYTTPDETFISNDGPYSPPSVLIPVSYDGTEEDDEEWAEALLTELDDQIEQAEEDERAAKVRTIRIVTNPGTNASEVADTHCHGDYAGTVRWYGSVDRVDSEGCGRVFIECSDPDDADAIGSQLDDDDDVQSYGIE